MEAQFVYWQNYTKFMALNTHLCFRRFIHTDYRSGMVSAVKLKTLLTWAKKDCISTSCFFLHKNILLTWTTWLAVGQHSTSQINPVITISVCVLIFYFNHVNDSLECNNWISRITLTIWTAMRYFAYWMDCHCSRWWCLTWVILTKTKKNTEFVRSRPEIWI